MGEVIYMNKKARRAVEKKPSQWLYWMALILFLACYAFIEEIEAGELRLITLNQSFHHSGVCDFKNDNDHDDCNETHNGFGIEYSPRDGNYDDYFGLLTYENSEYNTSRWIYYGKDYKTDVSGLTYGFQAGIIQGYNGMPVAPAAIPLMTYKIPMKDMALGLRGYYMPLVVGAIGAVLEF